MSMSEHSPMYLHLFYLNITMKFCMLTSRGTHSFSHSHTGCTITASQMRMPKWRKRKLLRDNVLSVFSRISVFGCMHVRKKEIERVRENTRDKRKTIENNKEQPLKQHAGIYIGVCQLWLWNFFSCTQTTHTANTHRRRKSSAENASFCLRISVIHFKRCYFGECIWDPKKRQQQQLNGFYICEHREYLLLM